MNVAFVGKPESRIYKLLERELVGFPFTVTSPEGLKAIKSLDVVITVRGPWGRTELVDLPIGLLQRFGAGFETVDLDAANQLGIWVANVPSLPSQNADSVADLAVFLLLGAARNARQLSSALEDGSWKFPLGHVLKGKTACLVGMGGLGLSIAERLQAFGMRLIGVRKNPSKLTPQELNFEAVYSSDDLKEALSRSYCAILSAAQPADALPLLGTDEIASMQKGSLLINVGRGSLVDEAALLASLNAEHLGGAGLDVFATEPLPASSPLLEHPNVFATPHAGGMTHEAMSGIVAFIGNNLRNYAAGKRLGSIVNEPIHPRVKLI